MSLAWVATMLALVPAEIVTSRWPHRGYAMQAGVYAGLFGIAVFDGPDDKTTGFAAGVALALALHRLGRAVEERRG